MHVLDLDYRGQFYVFPEGIHNIELHARGSTNYSTQGVIQGEGKGGISPLAPPLFCIQVLVV